MHSRITFTIALMSLALLLLVPPPQTYGSNRDVEIDYLLDFIQSSGCIFIRNGQEYDSLAAREHISMKRDYAGRWIKTTEDFIRLAATKSSVTGAPYRVRCEETEIPSARWLQNALHEYRRSSASRTH